MWRPDLRCGAEWTPCVDVGGVQIGDVRWNGRHVLMWAASRAGMLRGMDASVVMRSRSDLRCEAEWTPCADEGGVQIVD